MRSNLRENESVNLIIKKHWIVLTNPIMFLGIALLLYILSISWQTDSPRVFSVINMLYKFSIVGFIAAAIYLVYAYYERKFNIWVVTNQRVIDEWGVFSHNAKESPLSKINNVAHYQNLAGLMLGYGDVEIQTAAEQGSTKFTYVTTPKILNEAILTAQHLLADRDCGSPSAVPEQDTRECPFCSEKIKAKASICRFCQRDIPKPKEGISV
jgi:uncharacterized membrane protein YdbT with pleckstrin-like domain